MASLERRLAETRARLDELGAGIERQRREKKELDIEFSGWGRVFGDPNMAAAIIDRTRHHGSMIRFERESYRRTHALMQ